jgi:hypothetical protein
VILHRNLHHLMGTAMKTSSTLKVEAVCFFETSCQTINIRKRVSCV